MFMNFLNSRDSRRRPKMTPDPAVQGALCDCRVVPLNLNVGLIETKPMTIDKDDWRLNFGREPSFYSQYR